MPRRRRCSPTSSFGRSSAAPPPSRAGRCPTARPSRRCTTSTANADLDRNRHPYVGPHPRPARAGPQGAGDQQGAGFIYHCAEGQVGSFVAREWTDAANAGCLGKTFIGIHCSAIAADDWKRWDKAKAGAVVWSPFSNLWLYGATIDVGAARKRDVAVCLGSDWGPSGTKNVLGEIKVAKLVSEKLGLGLSDRALMEMVTTNPGDALSRCWNKTIGRLMPGAFGDIAVVQPKGNASVGTQIVQATEREVALVVCGGIPRYGDAALMKAPSPGPSRPITVRGGRGGLPFPTERRPAACGRGPTSPARLDAVRAESGRGAEQSRRTAPRLCRSVGCRGRAARAHARHADGRQPIAGDVRAHAAEIVIPRRPSLLHDASFFKSIAGRGFHGGVLDGLRGFYA